MGYLRHLRSQRPRLTPHTTPKRTHHRTNRSRLLQMLETLQTRNGKHTMPRDIVPVTDCPTCRTFEASRTARVRDWIRGLLTAITGPTTNDILRGVYSQTIHGVYRSALGIVREPDIPWYNRHLNRYVETGDIIELTRMERHIS